MFTGYKAFNSDFTCRGKQYAPHTNFHEDGDEPRKKGMMHFCQKPVDLFRYYRLFDQNGLTRFARVYAADCVFDNDVCATNDLIIKEEIPMKYIIEEINLYEYCTDVLKGYTYTLPCYNVDRVIKTTEMDGHSHNFVSIIKGEAYVWAFNGLMIVSAERSSELIVRVRQNCVIITNQSHIHCSSASRDAQYVVIGEDNSVDGRENYRIIEERM